MRRTHTLLEWGPVGAAASETSEVGCRGVFSAFEAQGDVESFSVHVGAKRIVPRRCPNHEEINAKKIW